MNAVQQFLHVTKCTFKQYVEARATSINTATDLIYSITEQNLKERQEAIEKEKATAVKAHAYVWQITLEYIMHMKRVMEYYDELPPGYSNLYKRVVKEQLDLFISTLKHDLINYEAIQQDSYFQLLLS